MKICWCTIHVNDLEESVRFYTEALGLSEERRFSPGPGMNIVFLKGDSGAEIELIYSKDEVAPRGSEALSIGFLVADLDAALEKMKRCSAKILRGPLVLGKDTRCFFAEDPNGIQLQIVAE